MKKILTAALMLAISIGAMAQSGTNSPYSQFGLGTLASEATGFNKGMNGLAYGFHERNQINHQNPASYSALDSLSFIFDAGVSLQLTQFEENGKKVNAKNGSIEYIVGAFRAWRHVGVSFGVMPISNIGYKYSNTANINAFPNPHTKETTYSNTFNGEGGLRQVYLGAAWEPVRGLSLGANIAYMWGTLERSVTNTYSDVYVNTIAKKYTSDVKSYKADFGLQYTQRLSKKDELTLGLTYALGHKLNGTANVDVMSTNSQTNVKDTTKFAIDKALELPHSFGVGVMYSHNNQLKVGFDYELQQWKKLQFPEFSINNNVSKYQLVDGLFTDRHRFTFGGDYCKSGKNHNLFHKMHYRAGVSYTTPYVKINGQDGPREISASLGLGIPVVNRYNNRSMLNISAEWVNRSAIGLIKENSFRINVGLTFNERWFAKFKVD